jgi:hypothetical protein
VRFIPVRLQTQSTISFTGGSRTNGFIELSWAPGRGKQSLSINDSNSWPAEVTRLETFILSDSEAEFDRKNDCEHDLKTLASL